MKTSSIFKAIGIVLCFLTFPGAGNAQFIIAGTATTADTYFDVSPDSLLEAAPYHLSNYPGEPMELDIDSDGVNDILISTSGGGGLGGGGGNCLVTPLIPNAEIMSHWDTSQGCCPLQYVALVADTIRAGDTISATKAFRDTMVYIWSTTYGAMTAPIIFQWNNIGEHFIGARLCYSFDTLYCWIRVEVNNSSYFIISIKDYACNRNTHIGLNEVASMPKPIVYPNPFTTELKFRSFPGSQTELILYSALSQVEMKYSFMDQISINTERLASGMYFYEIKSGTFSERGKVIKN